MHSLQLHDNASFDVKVRWPTEDLIFNLQLLEDIKDLTAPTREPHRSTLTVAGYDNGNLTVERVRVEPNHTNQGVVLRRLLNLRCRSGLA